MSKILDELIKEYESREGRGFLKYGTTMDREDLSLNDWIQHLLEELMDATIYLTKLKQKLNDTQRRSNYQEANSRNDESINTGGEASNFRTSL